MLSFPGVWLTLTHTTRASNMFFPRRGSWHPFQTAVFGEEYSRDPALLFSCTKANYLSCSSCGESIFPHPCHHMAYEARAWTCSPECCSWRGHSQLVLHASATEGKGQLCAAPLVAKGHRSRGPFHRPWLWQGHRHRHGS